MKNKLPSHSAQNGVSLVIALLLLLVLTVLGVASMSGSLMQERMAGNVNLQTLAFEAASAGVSGSAEFGLNKDNWPIDATTSDPALCSRGSGDWDPLPGWSDWSDPLFDDGTLPPDVVVEYRRRIGCFEPDEIPNDWELAKLEGFSVPTQLLVLNQGRVRRGDDVLAMREIEVRVENRAGDPACAIRIEGGLGEGQIDIKGGGPEVDGGEGGCSVSIGIPPDAPPDTGSVGDFIDAIGDQHIGKYTPPPKESDGHSPWNDPEVFADLMNQMKTAVLAYRDFQETFESYDPDDPDDPSQQEWRCNFVYKLKGAGEMPAGCDDVIDNENAETFPPIEGSDLNERILEFVKERSVGWEIGMCKSTFYEGNVRIGKSGNIPKGQCEIEGDDVPNWHNTDVPVGGPGNPPITYIAGHMGNPSNNSGSGLVIMEGGNCWSGTADFQGLQLILGGHYEIIGGGKGETEGSIVLTKLEERYGGFDNNFETFSGDLKGLLYENASNSNFDFSGLKFAGGGNHKISFACGGDGTEVGLADYIGLINQCLETDLKPNCGPDDGRRKAIASWREYVDRARWPSESE